MAMRILSPTSVRDETVLFHASQFADASTIPVMPNFLKSEFTTPCLYKISGIEYIEEASCEDNTSDV